MYLYPEHLKARAVMWLWQLKDLVLLGIGTLLSVAALARFQWYLPLAVTIVYGLLTIQVEGMSIRDFIWYAAAFFLGQRTFLWRYEDE